MWIDRVFAVLWRPYINGAPLGWLWGGGCYGNCSEFGMKDIRL
mgnify:CR=1 FL=1|jgi:hypothetical protein